ncbi:unnamed protein product [Camellia sinensis]
MQYSGGECSNRECMPDSIGFIMLAAEYKNCSLNNGTREYSPPCAATVTMAEMPYGYGPCHAQKHITSPTAQFCLSELSNYEANE